MNKTEISLDITVQKVMAAIEAAGDNEPLKNAIKALFSVKEAVKPTIDDYTTIKTYEDACEALGISPISTTEHDDDNDVVQTDTEHYVFPKHLVALYKLETISKALWGKWQPKPDAKGGEYYYYPWFALWTDEEIKREADDFKKKGALLAAYANGGSAAGFGCLGANGRSSHADARIGFRLCQETETKAMYFGRQFIDLWAEYLRFNFTTGERIY